MAAFSSPRDFRDEIVLASVSSFRKNAAGYKEGFYAFMAVDALAAQIYSALKNSGQTAAKDDTGFRQELAEQDKHFCLVRDVAKALKHCELTRGHPVLRRAADCKVGNRDFGSGLYGVGSSGGKDLMIELETGDTKHAVSEVIMASNFLSGQIEHWKL